MEKDVEFYKTICSNIKPFLESGMNVLELACGSGQLSIPLAPIVKNWLATDFSEKMIAQAMKREKSGNLTYNILDATAIPYEKESYDCVVISNALHIMPEPEKAMQEICRVLKPNGILYAPTFLWADGKASGFRKFMMSLTGFKAYRSWNRENFRQFIESFGFEILESSIVDGGLAPAASLAAVKRVRKDG